MPCSSRKHERAPRGRTWPARSRRRSPAPRGEDTVEAGHRIEARRPDVVAVGHPDVATVDALDVRHHLVQGRGHPRGPYVGRFGEVGVDVDHPVAVEQVSHVCSSSRTHGSVGHDAIGVESGELGGIELQKLGEHLVGVRAELRRGRGDPAVDALHPEGLRRDRDRTRRPVIDDLVEATRRELGIADGETRIARRCGRDSRRRQQLDGVGEVLVGSPEAEDDVELVIAARRPASDASSGSAARSNHPSTSVSARHCSSVVTDTASQASRPRHR